MLAGRLCVCAGCVALVSIVNTFMHAHAPVLISLVRSFYGMLLGALPAMLLIIAAHYLLSFLRKRKYFGESE